MKWVGGSVLERVGGRGRREVGRGEKSWLECGCGVGWWQVGQGGDKRCREGCEGAEQNVLE